MFVAEFCADLFICYVTKAEKSGKENICLHRIFNYLLACLVRVNKLRFLYSAVSKTLVTLTLLEKLTSCKYRYLYNSDVNQPTESNT